MNNFEEVNIDNHINKIACFYDEGAFEREGKYEIYIPYFMFPRVRVSERLFKNEYGIILETYVPLRTVEGNIYYQLFVERFHDYIAAYTEVSDKEKLYKEFKESSERKINLTRERFYNNIRNYIILHKPPTEEQLVGIEDVFTQTPTYHLTFELRKMNNDPIKTMMERAVGIPKKYHGNE